MTLTTNRTLHFLLVVSCLTYQIGAADDPVELTSSDDTWLSSDYTGKAQKRGEAEEVQIYGKTDDTGNRAIVKFDMKKAAPGFKAAILRMTCWNFSFSETRTSYFRCHPLLNAWTEESATWDIRNGKMTWTHPGGDFDPKPASGFMFTGPTGGGGDQTVRYFSTSPILHARGRRSPARTKASRSCLRKAAPLRCARGPMSSGPRPRARSCSFII